MLDISWKGVMPALMTEMHEDGSLDLDATARHISSCLDAGVEGFVMLGTLGETSSLSPEEKGQVLKCAVEAVDGKVPVLSGVAEYTTDLGIAHIRRAERAGCDGLMALPSMVYQQDQREGVAHFRSLANATDLPIMVYNNRISYRLDLTTASFEELSDCENIVAIKESSHDSRRLTDMINHLGDRYLLFCGVDDLALENLLFGAAGWVAGLVNSFPKETVAMYNFAAQGKTQEALEIYRWFMPSLHLDVDVKLVQYIKLANQMTGEGKEWVRRPRLILEGEERKNVEAIITKAIETRPDL